MIVTVTVTVNDRDASQESRSLWSGRCHFELASDGTRAQLRAESEPESFEPAASHGGLGPPQPAECGRPTT